MILADAGPLTAIIDSNDRYHQICVATLKHLCGPMLTTWAAFTEAAYLLGDRIGWNAQDILWNLVFRDDLIIAELNQESLKRSRELMKKYHDLPMDLADATLVALAEARNLSRIFTLDSDFEVYRLHGRKSFELVP